MRNMEQENKKLLEMTKEEEISFMSRITEFFVKLMDKFTKGKYSTPEEQEFFSDEKNLYNEDGSFTEEYQRRIDELEEYVRHNSVDDFLVEVHSKDSEEFGPAYNENEVAILKSGLGYISKQQEIVAEIIAAKKMAKRKGIPFDFDTYLKKRIEQEGDDFEEAKENIREYVKENIEEINEECPEFAEYLGIVIDKSNTIEEEE